MTWAGLASKFVKVILPFSFLASSPLVLNLVAGIGPVQREASVLCAFVAGLCIALVYIFLRRSTARRKGIWFVCLAATAIVCLFVYVYLESTFIYTTDPPGLERRVRGYQPVSDDMEAYIAEKGSIRNALKGNNWQSDGLFTEQSKVKVSTAIFILWNLLFASLCSAVAVFTLFEYTPGRKRRSKKNRHGPAAAEDS